MANVYPYPFNQAASSKFLDGSGQWQEVYNKEEIDQTEEVVAQAIADLDERLLSLVDSVSANTTAINAIDLSKLKSMTYSQLVTAKGNSTLEPGMFYRITDYATTTTQPNTQSAGHNFDVVVLALANNKLSDDAYAMLHSGDTYFADSNLSAWRIKYTTDNDTSRFGWADTTNGKGVIYYMKDEYNNECPYDFKNIQFKRWAITRIENANNYTYDVSLMTELENAFVASSNGGKNFAAKVASLDPSVAAGWVGPSTGLTITRDENSSVWYYTFTGMLSTDGTTINEIYDISAKPFRLSSDCISWINQRSVNSLFDDVCRDNVITPTSSDVGDSPIRLNNTVFLNGLSYNYQTANSENPSTTIWVYATSICYNNKIGAKSENNTIGNNCKSNICETIFSNNMFGNGVSYNHFGHNTDNNIIAGNYYENVSSNGFGNNTISSDIGRNSFGHIFFHNVIGKNFKYNTIGNDSQSNTIGDNDWYNVIGNGCANNRIPSNCSNNVLGNSVRHFIFGAPFSWFNIIENGNLFVTLTTADPNNTSGTSLLRNIRITQGFNYGNVEANRKTITHNTLMQSYVTVYQRSGSSTVDVQ